MNKKNIFLLSSCLFISSHAIADYYYCPPSINCPSETECDIPTDSPIPPGGWSINFDPNHIGSTSVNFTSTTAYPPNAPGKIVCAYDALTAITLTSNGSTFQPVTSGSTGWQPLYESSICYGDPQQCPWADVSSSSKTSE